MGSCFPAKAGTQSGLRGWTPAFAGEHSLVRRA
jgi:hypothetical protein